MTEEGDIVKRKTHTRFIFAVLSLFCTTALLAFAELSDGSQVAAFSFLGTVALGFGIAKFPEYWCKK